MIDLTRVGDVFVLSMQGGENRFTGEAIEAWNRALDEVEKTDGPKSLVTTGTGKFYSNGLDLDYMQSEAAGGPNHYLSQVLGIMERVLFFPAYTVAAMNGHAFGAGAQIALGHDKRIMRTERGYFCMPEIDMRSPLHPGMTAIIQARLPHQTAHEVIVTGTRYGAELARERKIVDEALPEDQVLPRAIEAAQEYAAKAHPAMRTLKQGMYEGTREALRANLERPVD